jgi:hypothetical protein
MKQRKNKAAWLLAGIISLTSFSACDKLFPEKTVDKNGVQTLCKNAVNEALMAGEQTEIAIGTEIGNKNYLTIKLQNDVPMVGVIHYTDQNDTSKTHKEKFFIEAEVGTFSMLLDGFRIGAFGAFEKRVDKITLQNVEGRKSGIIRISEVTVSDRTYNNTEMLYLENGSLKVGASLAAGGALCHLENLDRSVVEYIDSNGNIRIDEGIDANAVNTITDKVNLINVHDLGREIQQSYYANVGKENGYNPDDDVLYDGIGDGYLYNPVQAGSAGDKQTQIIDYELTEDRLYVKSRPQDWFFDNTQTDSYMESTYTFDKGGALIVTNRFINFSQFTGMDTMPISGHEIPAVYTVQPLNYFYCETRDGVIHDPNLSPVPTSVCKTSVLQEITENYYYQLLAETVVGDWLANVNDKGFGLGMYIPNVYCFSASRGWKSTSSSLLYNYEYDHNIYDLRDMRYIPSAYVNNYNYFSPSIIRRMVDFVPFEYSFALYVGRVDEMREHFAWLEEKGAIKNEGIDNWAKK